MEFSLQGIIKVAGDWCYGALAACALYGAYCVIMVIRRIKQKRFASTAAADRFLDEIHDQLQQKQFDAIAETCDSPAYWSKAVPQLILIALQNRSLGVGKLRRLVGERFEREIMADLQYRMSWIATMIKSAPMLGLLGTVLGMISAFDKIAGKGSTGVDPATLASDISLALFTTAIGLIIAIPLTMASNSLVVRLGKMQDSVQDYLGRFIDDLDATMAKTGGRS